MTENQNHVFHHCKDNEKINFSLIQKVENMKLDKEIKLHDSKRITSFYYYTEMPFAFH